MTNHGLGEVSTAPATMPGPAATETAPNDQGKWIVITAPLTETIDHAGYFIQMGMASMPIWMEGVMNRKYPEWRNVEHNPDQSARYMPAGVRLVEAALLREFSADDIVCCYPDDLDRFIGPNTRVVAVSTHNPLGVTFAAGVYTSIFGSSKMPINSHYSREMFAKIKGNPHRSNFKVIVGGSGGWQITQTKSFEELGVDCVVEGRSESADTMSLFHRAIAGEEIPREVEVGHPKERDALQLLLVAVVRNQRAKLSLVVTPFLKHFAKMFQHLSSSLHAVSMLMIASLNLSS